LHNRRLILMCLGCCLCVLIGQYEALAWLCGGLSFFAVLGLAAVVNDKASKIPFVSVHCYCFYFLAILQFPVLA
jgi:hypothetical protein